MSELKNRVFALCTFLLLCFCYTFAQEAPSKVPPAKQINNIKRTNEYVWAEATAESVPEAFEAANISLVQYISKYVEETGNLQKADLVVLKDKAAKCERIELQRGDMYKVFVYVKKEDIIPAQNVETITKAQWQAVAGVSSQDVPRHTSLKEPTEEQHTKKMSTPSDSRSSAMEQPNTPNPIIDLSPDNLKDWQEQLISELSTYESVQDVALYIDKNMAKGKIVRMGTASDPMRDPAKAFIATYDNNGKVTALYGKAISGKRYNYSKSSLESAEKYKTSKYVWFTLSN